MNPMKDEMSCCGSGGGCGKMVVLAALLLALGMIGGAYMLSKADLAPKVSMPSVAPNIYSSGIPPEHSISVSGTASKKVAPDLLAIQFSVETESPTASQSQTENAQVSAELLSKLAAKGVNETNIQTTSYAVQPVTKSVYRCKDKSYSDECTYDYIITGYKTTHTLIVQLSDLNSGGEIIDAASTAGVNQTFVDSVQFTLKDGTRRAIEKSLLQDASAEAKSKAQSIAQGLGTSLGSAISSSESFSYPSYYSYRAYDMAAAPSASTQLSAGQVDVSATVSVSFQIN